MECTDKCETCPFGGVKVGARGNPAAPIVLVGESPGYQEIQAGKPFVGPSGELLTKCLPIPLDDCYVLNALECQPKGKNQGNMEKAVKSCRGRLMELIKAHPRKIIITLGGSAIQALTGDYDLKVTKVRGKVFKSELAEHGILATIHPAYILRGGGNIKHMRQDIITALEIVGGTSTRQYIDPRFKLLSTEQGAKNLAKALKLQTVVAADIETGAPIPKDPKEIAMGGFNFRKDNILSVAVCWDPELVYIIPGKHTHLLKEAFEHPGTEYVWHNGKFDIRFIREKKVMARVDHDTMLLNYCLDETRGVHDLEQVASNLLGCPSWKKMLEEHIPKVGASYSYIPLPVLHLYQAKDTSATLQIFHHLRAKVAADKHSEKLYTQIMIPASEMLYWVEKRGFYVDWVWQERNKIRLEVEIEKLKEEINGIVGYSINPNSSKQVCRYVYDELRIRCRDRSSDAKTVLKWPDIPFKKALQKYRKATKAYSTYVIGYFELVGDDNRVHPTFMLHGTATGRLACRDPNLQNIPREPQLKGMYRAASGYILIEADYNQAELRNLAVMSKDPELLRIFNTPGMSLHVEVGKAIWGPSFDKDLMPDRYVRAKAVNFGIVYGRESYSLAEEFDISVREAQAMIDAWFKRFPKASEFIQKCRATVSQGQTMTTIFGRKKRAKFPSMEMLRALQNEAANFPHQSTASDFTLVSAIHIRPKLIKYDAWMVDLVHDSIIIECPNKPEVIKAVSKLVSEQMEQTPRDWGVTSVPFLTDIKLAMNWGNPLEKTT